MVLLSIVTPFQSGEDITVNVEQLLLPCVSTGPYWQDDSKNNDP